MSFCSVRLEDRLANLFSKVQDRMHQCGPHSSTRNRCCTFAKQIGLTSLVQVTENKLRSAIGFKHTGQRKAELLPQDKLPLGRTAGP